MNGAAGFAVPARHGRLLELRLARPTSVRNEQIYLATTLVNASTTMSALVLYLLGISKFFLYSNIINILYCLQQLHCK
jgi:hypothetical protein